VAEVVLDASPGERRVVVGGPGPAADALAAIGAVVGLAVRAEAPGSAGFQEASQGLGAPDAVVFVDHDDPALGPALTGGLGGAAGGACADHDAPPLVPPLTGVLGAQVGYVGVMGSRRHTPGFVDRLRQGRGRPGPLHSPARLGAGAT